jgi:oxygen-dependent protoporphyrinogen oxidase
MRATMGPIAEMERRYGSLAKAAAARRRSGEDSIERASAGARYEKFRAFRGGMKQFLDGLAQSLPEHTIELNSVVESLEPCDGTWRIHLRDQASHDFDHVVLAVPPHVAAGLLRPLSPDAADDLKSIEMASTAIVVMGVPREQISKNIDTFGFVVPLAANRRILAGSFASHKFAGRAPDDHVLVRVFIGGAMQPELLEKSDDELVRIAQEELADLIGMSGEPVVTRVVRWNDAMPQYHVGHLDRVQRIEQAIAKLDGLSLVNNCLHGVGIAPLVGLAGRVADEVVARLSQATSSDTTRGDGVRARSGP